MSEKYSKENRNSLVNPAFKVLERAWAARETMLRNTLTTAAEGDIKYIEEALKDSTHDLTNTQQAIHNMLMDMERFGVTDDTKAVPYLVEYVQKYLTDIAKQLAESKTTEAQRKELEARRSDRKIAGECVASVLGISAQYREAAKALNDNPLEKRQAAHGH